MTAWLRAIPSWQVTLGVALLALGFLVAAQLRSEGPRVRYTTQERSPLVETALDLQANQEELKSRILELNDQIAKSLSEGQGSAAQVAGLNAQLEQARLRAGLVALDGTGIVLQIEDSMAPAPPDGSETDYLVSGQDIRSLVEELWLAGAEAISVNGERVTGSTAIFDIGGLILVNQSYLAPPYQISAIGPRDIYARLSGSDGFVDFIRARVQAYGIQLGFAEPETVTVPAYAGTIGLRYAKPTATSRP